MSAPWWFDFEQEIKTHPMPPSGKEQLIALNAARTTLRRDRSRRGSALGVGVATLVLVTVWSLIFCWASVQAPSPWMPLFCALAMLGMGVPLGLQISPLAMAVNEEEDEAEAARKRWILIGSLLLLGVLLLPSLPLVIICIARHVYASHQADLQLKIEVAGKSLGPEAVIADPRYEAAAGAISAVEHCSRLRDRVERYSSEQEDRYPFELATVERYEDEAWGMLAVLADSFAEHPLGQAEAVVSTHWKLMAIKCIPMLTELKRLCGRS